MGLKRLLGAAFLDGKPDRMLLRGIDFFKEGDTHRALQCFDRILEQYPRCADAYYWKGWTLHTLGLHEEAIRQYDSALNLHPQSKKTLFQKGTSLAYLARFEEAITCYLAALAIDPQFAEALSNASVCYRRLGEEKKAMHYAQEAEKARGTYQTRLFGGGGGGLV